MDKRLILIGPGSMGMARGRCFNRIPGARLEAVVSRSEEKTLQAAAELGVPLAGTDLDRIADQKNPDAVIIAALNSAHYDLIKWALGRGLDVFVEGPLCQTSVQAEELMDLAIQNRRLIEVGFQRRYHPTIERARRLLADGEFGEFIYGEVEFFWNMRPSKSNPEPWYLDQKLTGGMAVAHMCYGLNTLRYVLGDPYEVFAAGNNFVYERKGQIKHDTISATLMYTSEAVANIIANFSAPPGFPTGMFKAHGTNGGFALQILDPPHGHFWIGDEQEEVPPLSGFDDLYAQCEAFVQALHGQGELLNHAMDSWRELRIIEGVIKSVERRKSIAVP